MSVNESGDFEIRDVDGEVLGWCETLHGAQRACVMLVRDDELALPLFIFPPGEDRPTLEAVLGQGRDGVAFRGSDLTRRWRGVNA